MNCLGVFNHFVGLALTALKRLILANLADTIDESHRDIYLEINVLKTIDIFLSLC